MIKTGRGEIPLGKNRRIFQETPVAAGTVAEAFQTDAESVLISLWVNSSAGDIDVVVYTHAEDLAHRRPVITFPTVSATSTELLIRKAAAIMSQLVVEVTYTGACDFEIWARGVTAAASSVRISGASDLRATQIDVSVAGTLLLPAALVDRSGIGIQNHNSTGEELFIGESPAASATTNGWSIPPGGVLTIDLSAGVEVYASPSAGTVDVRIMETGGS